MPLRAELSVNRSLLAPSFEGYKLGGGGEPESTRIELIEAPSRPDRVRGHSLQHARLRALHNALVDDPHSDRLYYADSKGGIWSVRAPPALAFERVFVDPKADEARDADCRHPPSIDLFAEDMAVATMGDGRLLLLRTGDRKVDVDQKWTLASELEPFADRESFTVLCARSEASNKIHVVLYRIEPDERHSSARALLDWIALTRVDGVWTWNSYRTLRCPAPVHYCRLEPSCEALYVAADRPVDFVRDDKTENGAQSQSQNGEKKKPYRWVQNSEEITLTVKLGDGTRRTFEPTIEASARSLVVLADGAELFRGELHGRIEDGLTTWTVRDDGDLDVLLIKKEPGSIWASFLKDGDVNGERSEDPAFVAQVHERLAHLCSETEVQAAEDAPLFNSQQLEECDFTAEEESCLVRLHAATYSTTHRAFLGSHQFVLAARLSPGDGVPALGLRYDADVCLWRPHPPASSPDSEWPLKHEGTLPAFGYVQSSKEQKKYAACAPGLSYAVVCEAQRHAFVYWPRTSEGLRLRSPATGDATKVRVGKQKLIAFGRDEEVLGLAARDDYLYVITEKHLIRYDMAG